MSNNKSKPVSKIILSLFVIAGGFASYYYYTNQAPEKSVSSLKKKYVVAVSQLIDFPVLNQVRQGIIDGLADKGFIRGENIEWIYENAQGNIPTTVQIAKKLVGLKPDVLVAIATPPAQAFVSTKTTIPVVFAAVTDPVSTKLVKSLEHPGGTITGATDNPPVEKNIDMIRHILPDAKTLGILYNSSEPNSVLLVQEIQEIGKKYGFSFIVALVPKTSEALTATRSLMDKVDGILFPLDNTVTAVASSIVKLASEKKIPVFALDPAIVKEGALASIGVSEYQGGVEAGKIIARILQGEKARNIPVVNPQKEELFLNFDKAAEFGIAFPEDLKTKAQKN